MKFASAAGAAALALMGTVQVYAMPAEVEGPPPMKHGVYIAKGACPGEGCTYEYLWRATKRAPLYASKAGGKPTGWIKPGEALAPVYGEVQVTPVRGVVKKRSDPFAPGDEIYLLDPVGEGESEIWSHGRIVQWMVPEPDSGVVAWDKPLETAFKMVWWVQVKRSDGSRGWLRDPSGFECSDQFGGDSDCKPAPAKPKRP
jgi:hypothetical protein